MKNRQKWLTSKLKGDWQDKDLIIETVLFESLVHFVENEEGLSQGGLDWSEEIKDGFVDQAYVDRIRAREDLLRHCYDWIKVKRPEIQKKLDSIEDWREYEKIENELHAEDTEIMKIIIEQRGYMWT